MSGQAGADWVVVLVKDFDAAKQRLRPSLDSAQRRELARENARLALPNKLFEYLMAGLAVVVPEAPAMASLVKREGVGRTFRPGRLGDVLKELAADRAAVEAMRRRARAVAVERYNAEAQRPALYAAWGL